MQCWQALTQKCGNRLIQTHLIYLMYILFFVAIIATVVGVLFQFGAALKDNPGAALKSLIGLVILVAVVVISWTMGSEEPLVIPGYSGTENVPFWLKLTDMFLYSILYLVCWYSLGNHF